MSFKRTVLADGTIILTGSGAIAEANGILAQRDTGRERGGLIIIRGRRAIEPLINGDYGTNVYHRWNNAHHAGEFLIESTDEIP
jgi:hypothetical protein